MLIFMCMNVLKKKLITEFDWTMRWVKNSAVSYVLWNSVLLQKMNMREILSVWINGIVEIYIALSIYNIFI